MRRLVLPAGLALAAAFVAIVVVAVVDTSALAHGYFAAWLVAVSLPLGALPLLMLVDLLGIENDGVTVPLRLLLASLPVLALFVIPALLDLKAFFPWVHGSALASSDAEHYKGLGRGWFSPGAFRLRTIVFLAIWTVLSLFFVRPTPPSRRHRSAAGIGLAIHLAVGTLAAFDWYMSLDQAFTSSAYGLVVMSVQSALALAVAMLLGLALSGSTSVPSRNVILALLVLGFVAFYTQASQFLVIWSANLPKEIAWYQARWGSALATIFVVAIPLLAVGGYALLMPASLNRFRPLVAAGLILLALIVFIDMLCLVSPRGTFTVPQALLVIAFLVVLCGFGAASAAVLAERRNSRPREVRHG